MIKTLRIIIISLAVIGILAFVGISLFFTDVNAEFYAIDNNEYFRVLEQSENNNIKCRTLFKYMAMDIRGNGIVFVHLEQDDIIAYADEIIEQPQFKPENGLVVYDVTFNTNLNYFIEKNIAMAERILRIFYSVIALFIAIIAGFLLYITSEKGYRIEGKLGVSILRFFLLFVFVFLTEFVIGVYFYVSKTFSDITLSQLIFHTNTDLTGTNWDQFSPVIRKLLIVLAITFAACVILYILYRLCYKKASRKVFVIFGCLGRFLIVAACVAALCYVLQSFYYAYSAFDYLVSQSMSTKIYDEYYADGNTVAVTFPEKKKNLVHIIIESMETTCTSPEYGGAKKDNLIPELTESALENDCFNGGDGLLNGAYVVGNTGWTIAGMVAQSAGVPLNFEVDGNEFYADSFLPGACSIGDILEDNGYDNYILMGSEADFAGRDKYYSLHGNYNIYDLNWAKKTKRLKKKYFIWWGFEDDKLYEYAEECISKISKNDKPFNFTLLTADTHFPDGFICEDCEDKYDVQYDNVLACSSRKAIGLVNWLKEQDFYDDTVIVITGDHLYMDVTEYEDVPEEYERKVYVDIINSSKEEPAAKREYSTFDIFPTTLSAMGCTIEGDRLGLGTDLYSQTPTLTELMGKNMFDTELNRTSDYYNKKILYKNKK